MINLIMFEPFKAHLIKNFCLILLLVIFSLQICSRFLTILAMVAGSSQVISHCVSREAWHLAAGASNLEDSYISMWALMPNIWHERSTRIILRCHAALQRANLRLTGQITR